MTKSIRVENADTSNYRVLVQVWGNGWPIGEPDELIKETILAYPTSLDTFMIHSNRWMVIKELPPEYPKPIK